MSVDLAWVLPPADLAPPAETEVHVWRIPLAQDAATTEALLRTLAPDEQARAARFRMRHHSVRFIVGRGATREVLGRYLGAQPAEFDFDVGPHGKPALAAPGAGRLCFNLSNSGDLALLAVFGGGEVGVDLEEPRAVPDAVSIAGRMFSAAERRALLALPAEHREAAFLRVWTRKEAFIKAQGGGVWTGLDRFDVSLGDEAALLAVDGSAEEAARWRMRSLHPGGGYLAALVTFGAAATIRQLRWVAGP